MHRNLPPSKSSPTHRQPYRGSRRSRRAESRRGAYSVEFAICASILFMLVFGLFEFSRYLFVRQAIDQAAYEAARIGIVPGANEGDIRARAVSLLGAAGVSGADITITPEVIDDETREVSVEIICNFEENSFLPSVFLGGGVITTRTTLDHENQAFLIPDEATESQALNENDEPQDV
jgi:hypothetical protein